MTRQIDTLDFDRRLKTLEGLVGKLNRPGTGTSGASTTVVFGPSVEAETSYGLDPDPGDPTVDKTVSHYKHKHGTPGLSANTPKPNGDASPGNGDEPPAWDHVHPLDNIVALIQALSMSGVTSWTTDGDNITFTSIYGIDADGIAYYDPAGAASGEDALLTLEPATGRLWIVQPEGG